MNLVRKPIESANKKAKSSAAAKTGISGTKNSAGIGKKGSKNGLQNSRHTVNHKEPNLFEDKEFLTVLTEVKNGNFRVRMPIDKIGIQGKICDTMNEIISLNEEMMLEFTRAGNTIGKQGKLNQRIGLPSIKGAWSTGVGALNALIADLVTPTIEIAHVISSVAKGNLSQEMPLEIGGHSLQGEFSRIAKEVNDMVTVKSFNGSHIAREVGSKETWGQAK
jgi:HAMP domain-containing protein